MKSNFFVFIVLLITSLSCLLQGGNEAHSKITIFALMAVTSLVFPASLKAHKLIAIPFALFILYGISQSFLPSIPESMPSWRQAVQETLNLNISGTINPQPWIGLESTLYYLVLGLWFIYLSSHILHKRQISFILMFIAGLATLSSFISFYLLYTESSFSHWGDNSNERSFGPFPNRNHFGTLLAVASIISSYFTRHYYRKHTTAFLFHLFSTAIIFLAILYNHSRAGMLLSLAAHSLWLGHMAISARSVKAIVLNLSVLLIIFATLFSIGGTTINRLQNTSTSNLSSEGRIPIYSDTLSLISDNLLTGIGNGNFASIFPFYRDQIQHEDQIIHPESDILWLISETGMMGLFFIVSVGVYLIVICSQGKVLKRSRSRTKRLQFLAFIGLLVIGMHSAFDVPLHTTGIFTIAALLFLILRQERHHDDDTKAASLAPLSRWRKVLSYTFPAIFAASSAFYFITLKSENSIPSETGARTQYTKATKNYQYAPAESLTHIEKCISWNPINYRYYFFKAANALQTKNPDILNARKNFRIARSLEPNSRFLPLQELRLWMKFAPSYSIPTWRDLLARDPSRITEHYGNLLKQSHLIKKSDGKAATEQIYSLGLQQASTAIQVLKHCPPSEFDQQLETVLLNSSNFKNYFPEQRVELFQIWNRKGDLNSLLQLIKEDETLLEDAWEYLALDHSNQGQHERAYYLAINYLERPKATVSYSNSQRSIQELEKLFILNPTDINSGKDLYLNLIEKGKNQRALSIIKKLFQLESPPSYLYYSMAITYAKLGDYRNAWDSILSYKNGL